MGKEEREKLIAKYLCVPDERLRTHYKSTALSLLAPEEIHLFIEHVILHGLPQMV